MSTDPNPWQLPDPLDSLVGRTQELRRLRTLLRSHQLVTLVGPGGVGKTRLATELARRMSRGGVQLAFLVELDGVPDRGLPLRAMAEVLGLGEGAARRDWAALAEVIGERRMVTVLDSCENLLDSPGASLGSLLRRCPRLRIVATSREPLQAPGELVIPVEPLALPDRGPDLSRTTALRSDAVRLFVARARCSDPTFELTDDNAGTVAEICHRLDGLPLAVELAAGRIGALPADGVLAALDDQLAVLTDGNRTGPDRHRELRAAISWSFHLLSAPERTVFRRLSVLVGGFDLAAATAVCQGGAVQPTEVPGILSALVDKSLVVRVRTGGPLRYRQLNALRAYGGELLAASGELPATCDRAASWLAQLARPITTTLCVSGVLLRRLREERENLIAALRFSAARTGPHSGARRRDRHLLLAIALARICQEQDQPAAGRPVLAEALDRAYDSVLRGEALAAAAALAARQHDLGPALRLAEEAVSVERASGRRIGLAKALDALSFAHLCRGENELAATAQRECVAVTVAAGRALDIALARHNLAWQLLQTGDLVEAEELLGLALPVYRRHHPSPRAHAVGLHTAGVLHLMRGDSAGAERYFLDGLDQAPADSVDGAPLVEALAIIAAQRGAFGRTLRLVAAAAAARRRHGVVPTPDWRRRVADAVEDARRQLDPVAVEAATTAGERLRGKLLRSYALRGANSSAAGEQLLTTEELRIVALVAEGATNAEVADELRLSISTIKARLTQILDKLDLTSRTQLAVWAVRQRIVTYEVS